MGPSRWWVRLLLCCAVAVPISLAQTLHTQLRWPTDQEFLSVNQTVEAACRRWQGVEEELVWALIWQESKYDPFAVGLSGEVGLGQLMPATAKALGVKNRTDISESVNASVRHLAYLSKKYRNNVQLVLAAYNIGEPVVDRCRCVPTASRAYVDRIQQNRVFAKRIVQYVRESALPVSAEVVKVATLETKLNKLQQERPEAGSPRRTDLEQELAQARSDLGAARTAFDKLRGERDRLLAELQQDNSLGARALAVTQSLRQRLETVESQVASNTRDAPAGTEAPSELVAIRADLAQLKSVIQSQNATDVQTQQRIGELTALVGQLSERAVSASARIPLVSSTASKEPPLIAVIAAAERLNGVQPDAQLAGALQDGSLRRGLAVNVDLQTAEFVSRNLSALLAGDGRSLQRVKPKRGRKWDYAILLKVADAVAQDGFGDTRSFLITAESRLYTTDGKLLSVRTFSQTGAGFTDAQARDAAITRLGESVGDFLDASIRR